MAAVQPGKPEVLYVSNIPKSASDEEIKAWLAARAPAAAISVATSRRFFYAAYASEAEATAAISKLTGQDFGGRVIEAEKSRTPKTPEEIEARNAERDAARAERKASRAAAAAAAPKPAAAGGAGAAAPAEKKFHDKRVVLRSGNEAALDPVALERIFSTCGPVTRVRVAEGSKLARLTFENAEAAKNAITLSGTDLAGNVFKVEYEIMRKKKKSSKAKKAAAAAGGAGAPAAAAAKPAAAPKKAREPRPAAAPAADAPKKRVRVDGLKEGQTVEDLKAAFAGAGAITNAKIVKAGTHGFVTFEDAAAVPKALGVAAVKDAAVTVSVDEAARRPRTPRTPVDVTNSLWVAGMENAKEEQLRALFAAHGVESVKVIARGKAAYVRLTSEAAVAGAVAAVNGASLEGQALTVEKATGPQKARRSKRRAAEGAAASA